jgi:hypothetical protein
MSAIGRVDRPRYAHCEVFDPDSDIGADRFDADQLRHGADHLELNCALYISVLPGAGVMCGRKK